ncbi:assimilatory nitrate reductase electron transfer subunit [Spinactinospora alkalitolerans]|uniref:Assimilatory nitrate reductase electron transfer subunit n=1 Tax=Spinactinospora alkalitolerans TaxID=687207 RepID=A0A852TTR8_9ACTN|nr:FAD-dependent oxidoreductase [Spinactinospora alkalitolerans]NYE47419.1 assimilatory nitrate reductase electron transfer subunit [Spinactinospora alkalitolerans]
MTQQPRHVAVIGHGMVGARFVEEVARRDPDGRRVRLTVVGAEAERPYNRILLPEVVTGRLDLDDLALPEADSAAVTVRRGVAATAVDPAARRVALDDGTGLDYDELVLATGARAAFPPVAGLSEDDGAPAPGVTALRGVEDCRRLMSLVRPGAPAVVLGGGVLGLEAARALSEGGVRVSVVESSPWLMRRQIDQAAASILSERLTAIGIAVHSWRVAARWLPGTGLELDDGRVLAGDALIVTAGVRARTELAAGAGLAVEHGVVVDDALTTADPRIHAIGDCAQHARGGAGLVQPGWEQAAVLADLLTGTAPGARYRGVRPVTRLKAEGIELASLGDADADGTAETVTVSDPHGGRYAKLSVRGDRVVGAILLGFPDSAATIAQLYDQDAPVPSDRLALLLGAARPEPRIADQAGPALVCRCNGVSREQLEEAWLDGARTRQTLAEQTRATTGCGGCVRDVNALLAGWNNERPAPAR